MSKKQVIIYVDVPDDAPDGVSEWIEEEVGDILPSNAYIDSDEEEGDAIEVPLDWGGVTVRDA